MMIPPKPAQFTPELSVPGVEIKFVTFVADRPRMPKGPRSVYVHTNGARGEGSVDSAWNWSHSQPNRRTLPHYQVDRTHNGATRARKMLPTDLRGIANATVTQYQGGHGDISWFSLAIETADLGWPTPGHACGFDPGQSELISQIIAYECYLWNIPVEYPPVWYGAGVASHTEPYGYPYTTLYNGKVCPGDQKKLEVRTIVMPRAQEILSAWRGTVVPPAPIGKKEKMILVDYGKPGADWWWTRCVIAGNNFNWVQGSANEWTEPSGTHRTIEELCGDHIQVKDDDHFCSLLSTYRANTQCPDTFTMNDRLTAVWEWSKDGHNGPRPYG